MSKSRKFGLSPKYFDVGYKTPPKHSRFRKGKSGNPRGRPMHKKYATIDTLFAEEGQRRMTVTVGGRKRSITMAEAVIKIAYQQALKGDKTMLKEVLQKLANLPAPPDENTWIYRISPKQEEIFDAVLKDAEEFRRETNEGSEDN